AHRTQRGQQAGEVSAVADADHGNGRGIHVRARDEPVIGGEQVGQVLRAAHRLPLRGGFLVAAQVEGQADAADAGGAAGTAQVVVLAATPAMYEQHSGQGRRGREDGAADDLVFDRDVDRVKAYLHAPQRT